MPQHHELFNFQPKDGSREPLIPASFPSIPILLGLARLKWAVDGHAAMLVIQSFAISQGASQQYKKDKNAAPWGHINISYWDLFRHINTWILVRHLRHPKNIQKQTPFSQLLGSVQPFNSYFDQLFGLVNSQAAFLSPFLSSKYVAFLCHLHGPDGYIPSEKQKGTGGRLDSKQSSQMEGRRKQSDTECALCW